MSVRFSFGRDCSDRILLIDNDPSFGVPIREYLQTHGFAVDLAHTAEDGIKRARTAQYSMVLLEFTLPRSEGFRILSEVRRLGSMDILVLSQRRDEEDRIIGLELGADDYLAKPFSLRELLARIHSVRRRTHTSGDLVRGGDLLLDTRARLVTFHEQILELTTLEFALLEIFLRSAGNANSREAISVSVLGRKFDPFDRSVDMLVSRLRKKLKAAGVPDHIKTIRSLGYQFAVSSHAHQHSPLMDALPVYS